MPALEPLFIDGPSGRLFVVHHPPVDGGDRCVIVVPAFAEEMNKSRRQLALLARALRAAGSATIIVDLRGTGDSEGALKDCTIDGWVADLDAAVKFANARGYTTISLLALRAGALLSVPFLARDNVSVRKVVWWQPLVSGKMLINQFLRLRTAAGMMAEGSGESVKSLRERLAQGQEVEVAGYMIAPALAAGFDALELSAARIAAPVVWFNIGAADAVLSVANRRTVEALGAAGTDIDWRAVAGEPFWATAEIATAPAAIEASVAPLSGDS